jgi:hypothetical protein
MFTIHSTFPKEMAVIGRILVDYGELEVDLMNCVQVARSFDLNGTLKAMFRVRGEGTGSLERVAGSIDRNFAIAQ